MNGKLINVGGAMIVVHDNDTEVIITNSNGKLGRPVNPSSERQKRLQAMELKKQEQGELKRGRPVVENSDRQQRLQAIEIKKEAGIEIKRGRPKLVEVQLNGQLVKIQEGTIIN
jgi:hypothetical protein